MNFRYAEPNDLNALQDLLRSSGLPFDDIERHLPNFIVAESDGAIAACAGLEVYGLNALLRSVAVKESMRNNGIGLLVIREILESAKLQGIDDVYLLTTTASNFFRRFGFSDVMRSEAPESIRSTSEFSSFCPSGASFMHLHLKLLTTEIRRH